MCLIPFSRTNCPNTSEVNCAPLSVTICSGKPWVENIFLSSTIVLSAVVVIIGITSGHFEWASTTIRYDLSMNGPAKSTCKRCQGRDGQVHGCRVDGAGLFLRLWQGSHFCTISSICLSTLGHHTWVLASDFILTIPMCPVWSSSNTLPCSL